MEISEILEWVKTLPSCKQKRELIKWINIELSGKFNMKDNSTIIRIRKENYEREITMRYNEIQKLKT